MTKLFVAALLIFSSLTSSAQKFSDSLYAKTSFLRFNAIGLADVTDLNISFGAEKKISKRSSFALDLGYIPYSQLFADKSVSGFIVRPAYRFFPAESLFLIEVELHFKQVSHDMEDWLGRDIVNGIASYEQYMDFKLRRTVWGAHLKAGRQYYLSNRFWLELYLGLGVHFRRYTIANNRNQQYQVTTNFTIVNTGQTEKLLALPAGVRLLYRLDKRAATHPKR